MGKNQHVTPHPDGGWQVKGAGNSRATVRTETQKEAIDIARDKSSNGLKHGKKYDSNGTKLWD